MKKISVVSIIALSVAHAVFAESFPGNGYMLENKTYDGAATYTNMGVYSDSVSATADYTNDTYEIMAGTYLPAGSETVTQCPANSFCPGLTGPTYYDANNAQGATACPSGYPNSAAGASASTDCYTACTTANVAHSASVTGNDYDGGTDTCSAASCELGYHVHNETPSLNTIIDTVAGTEFVYIMSGSGTVSYTGTGNASTYGISDNNSFAVDYDDRGAIIGRAQCSSIYGNKGGQPENFSKYDTLPDSTGINCYCSLDSYVPANSAGQSVTGPWVYSGGYNTPPDCMSSCAANCAIKLRATGSDDLLFRAAVLGSMTMSATSPATCEANTITINWSDVDGANGTHTTDVSYDGDITTPVKAATKPGKTFVGWKFVKPGS